MVWSSAQQNSADAGQQHQQYQQQQIQQQQGMQNANGGASGGAAGPAAAEYTLQGVMRFLQTEWHKHERDRNSWEIERAEMKARIAKLEGENRAEKRLHQMFQLRIGMLEKALKRERMSKGGEGENGEPPKLSEKTAQSLEEAAAVLHRADAQRSASKQYLEKCLQEITYLLTPPSHPAPSPTQPLPQGGQMDPSYSALYAQEPPNRPPQQPLPQQPSFASQHQGNSFPPYKGSQRVQRTEQPPIAIPEGLDGHSISKIPAALRGKETNPFAIPDDNRNPDASSSTSSSEVGDDEWDFSLKSDTSESNGDEQEHRKPGSRRGSRGSAGSPLIRKRLSLTNATPQDLDAGNFKVKFAMRGHLDVIRTVCFTGGGTLDDPEIATAGDDAVIKRWLIPSNRQGTGANSGDIDVTSHFTHRGHAGMVTSLAAAPALGGGDGWLFSGGLDTTVKVWANGRVDAKATLVGHTDVVWTVCVLPRSAASGSSASSASSTTSSGSDSSRSSSASIPDDRILLASGSADGTVKIWAVTPPPALPRRSSSASIRNLLSQDPLSVPITYTLLSTITRPDLSPSPTSITPLSPTTGESFLVAYNDASVVLYDTATGEQITEMQSKETYDGTDRTGVSCVVATMEVMDMGGSGGAREEGEKMVAGATGSGVVITGHEDRFVRIFDANSGQCTYTMLAHPASIASLALSPDGRELVSGGHDASLRFWSMEKRSCTQEITAHRLYRGEGVCAVAWSQDGRWVVSAGGDGVVKVYSR